MHRKGPRCWLKKDAVVAKKSTAAWLMYVSWYYWSIYSISVYMSVSFVHYWLIDSIFWILRHRLCTYLNGSTHYVVCDTWDGYKVVSNIRIHLKLDSSFWIRVSAFVNHIHIWQSNTSLSSFWRYIKTCRMIYKDWYSI